MADTVRLELTHCRPDGFRPNGFSGMNRQSQTMVRRVLVDFAKLLGAGFAFVAANADAYHIVGLQADRLVYNAPSFVHPEMANRIEVSSKVIPRSRARHAGVRVPRPQTAEQTPVRANELRRQKCKLPRA